MRASTSSTLRMGEPGGSPTYRAVGCGSCGRTAHIAYARLNWLAHLQFQALRYCLSGGLARELIRAAEKIRIDPHRGELLADLASLEGQVKITPELLEVGAQILLQRWRKIPTVMDISRSEALQRKRLGTLSREAGMYLRYLAMLQRFFSDSLDRTAFKDALQPGQVDRMVRIRQALDADLWLIERWIDDVEEAVPPGASSCS